MTTKHTAEPWEYRKIPAGEHGIFAKLRHPKGEVIAQIFETPEKPHVISSQIHKGVLEFEVGYSTWYQFPIGDWNEKQWEANAQRIVDCVNGCEGVNPKAIKELLRVCKEIVPTLTGLSFSHLKRAIVNAENT